MNALKNKKRDVFRKKRQEISGEKREIFSEKICNNLSDIFRDNIQTTSSRYIALFAGTQEEPDLSGNSHGCSLLEKIPHQKFCFPKIEIQNTSEEIMNFYEVQKISDLEEGKFGIFEPRNFCKKISPEEISIFCIPAIGIDFSGNRIGMGGGFYDIYLSQIKSEMLKIGVVFSCQISETSFSEFSEDFDIPVDMIVSEEERVITPNYQKAL